MNSTTITHAVLTACALFILWPLQAGAQALDASELKSELDGVLTADAGIALSARLHKQFGKDKLAAGVMLRGGALDVAWAIDAPGAAAAPSVASADGSFRLALHRLGATNVYAGATTLPSGTGISWSIDVDGATKGRGQLEVYTVDPLTLADATVPKGKLTQRAAWESKVFDGTKRDWWVYIPAQYNADSPACVMVFQDGASYRDVVQTVFDNLIARGDMPVTVAILLNPGAFADGRSNRSFEYDTLSDQYARFLLEEILPEVSKTVKLRTDASSRAISGISSGGICAFTAAWERPNEFSKVLSWVGSFTNIASGSSLREGGHNYQALIRKTNPKPIRVFLQDGSNDLDNNHGNWPLANQEMAKSLAFKSYDNEFVYGQGFHSAAHGRAIFPASLKWLWRDYKP